MKKGSNEVTEEELNTQETDSLSNEEVKETVEKEAEVEAAIEETEIDLLKQKNAELEDQNLRLQAEIVNMRNRNQKDREQAAKYRSQDLAKELLPAIDNLERALEADVKDSQGEALKKGVEMVLNNLKQALKAHGIEEIEALGKEFDPTVHQAVQTVPVEEGGEANVVVQEFQKGYKLHDRVLRPAMVVVAQ